MSALESSSTGSAAVPSASLRAGSVSSTSLSNGGEAGLTGLSPPGSATSFPAAAAAATSAVVAGSPRKRFAPETRLQQATTQEKTFIRWVNHHLAKVDVDGVRNMDADFRDGTKICWLLSILTGTRLTFHVVPERRWHRIDNLHMGLQTLQQVAQTALKWSAEDIELGNKKQVMAIVYAILRRYQFSCVVVGEPSGARVKYVLLAWCKSVAESVDESLKIANFDRSFGTGLPLCALASRFCEGYNYPTDKTNEVQNTQAALEALTLAGVPDLLDANDVCSSESHIDETSMMIYVACLHQRFVNKPMTAPPGVSASLTRSQSFEVNSAAGSTLRSNASFSGYRQRPAIASRSSSGSGSTFPASDSADLTAEQSDEVPGLSPQNSSLSLQVGRRRSQSTTESDLLEKIRELEQERDEAKTEARRWKDLQLEQHQAMADAAASSDGFKLPLGSTPSLNSMPSIDQLDQRRNSVSTSSSISGANNGDLEQEIADLKRQLVEAHTRRASELQAQDARHREELAFMLEARRVERAAKETEFEQQQSRARQQESEHLARVAALELQLKEAEAESKGAEAATIRAARDAAAAVIAEAAEASEQRVRQQQDEFLARIAALEARAVLAEAAAEASTRERLLLADRANQLEQDLARANALLAKLEPVFPQQSESAHLSTPPLSLSHERVDGSVSGGSDSSEGMDDASRGSLHASSHSLEHASRASSSEAIAAPPLNEAASLTSLSSAGSEDGVAPPPPPLRVSSAHSASQLESPAIAPSHESTTVSDAIPLQAAAGTLQQQDNTQSQPQDGALGGGDVSATAATTAAALIDSRADDSAAIAASVNDTVSEMMAPANAAAFASGTASPRRRVSIETAPVIIQDGSAKPSSGSNPEPAVTVASRSSSALRKRRAISAIVDAESLLCIYDVSKEPTAISNITVLSISTARDVVRLALIRAKNVLANPSKYCLVETTGMDGERVIDDAEIPLTAAQCLERSKRLFLRPRDSWQVLAVATPAQLARVDEHEAAQRAEAAAKIAARHSKTVDDTHLDAIRPLDSDSGSDESISKPSDLTSTALLGLPTSISSKTPSSPRDSVLSAADSDSDAYANDANASEAALEAGSTSPSDSAQPQQQQQQQQLQQLQQQQRLGRSRTLSITPDEGVVCIYGVTPDHPYTIFKVLKVNTVGDVVKLALIKANKGDIDPKTYCLVETSGTVSRKMDDEEIPWLMRAALKKAKRMTLTPVSDLSDDVIIEPIRAAVVRQPRSRTTSGTPLAEVSRPRSRTPSGDVLGAIPVSQLAALTTAATSATAPATLRTPSRGSSQDLSVSDNATNGERNSNTVPPPPVFEDTRAGAEAAARLVAPAPPAAFSSSPSARGTELASTSKSAPAVSSPSAASASATKASSGVSGGGADTPPAVRVYRRDFSFRTFAISATTTAASLLRAAVGKHDIPRASADIFCLDLVLDHVSERRLDDAERINELLQRHQGHHIRFYLTEHHVDPDDGMIAARQRSVSGLYTRKFPTSSTQQQRSVGGTSNTQLSSTSNSNGCLMITPGDQFNVEDGNNHSQYGIQRPLVENDESTTAWFAKHFNTREHQNYLGSQSDGVGTFVLSVRREQLVSSQTEGLPVNPYTQYRLILWLTTGLEHLTVAVRDRQSLTPTHLLRAIQPSLSSCKLKQIDGDISRELLQIEDYITTRQLKFGVLYKKAHQVHEEHMFSNREGSPRFDDFLKVLGDKVELKGWPYFRAGLDVKDNTTGTHSVYTRFSNYEIMFHVSTLLPFAEGDKQQLERKRHIGNDICAIVFEDLPEGVVPTTAESVDDLPAQSPASVRRGASSQPSLSMEVNAFDPGSVASHYLHVFAVVSPVFNELTNKYEFLLNVASKTSVPPYGPALPSPPRFTSEVELREFLLTKLINGETATLASPAFKQRQHRTLTQLIRGIEDRATSSGMLVSVNSSKSLSSMAAVVGSGLNNSKASSTGSSLRRKLPLLETFFTPAAGSSSASPSSFPSLSVTNMAPVISPPTSPVMERSSFSESTSPSASNTDLSGLTLSSTSAGPSGRLYKPAICAALLPRVIQCGAKLGEALVLGTDAGLYIYVPFVSIPGSTNPGQPEMFKLPLHVERSFTQISVIAELNLLVACAAPTASPGTSYIVYYDIAGLKQVSLRALSSQPAIFECQLEDTKNCNIFALDPFWESSADATTSFRLCVSVKKTLLVYRWQASSRIFQRQLAIGLSDTCVTLGISGQSAVLGFSDHFALVSLDDTSDASVDVLHATGTDMRPVDVLHLGSDEFFVCYNNLGVFVNRRGQSTRSLIVRWTIMPNFVVYAFPNILGFSTNSIEVRTLVNGNLIQVIPLQSTQLITVRNSTKQIFVANSYTINQNTANEAVVSSVACVALND
ncbi:hypothetical protein CAOG_08551 [Capsaspora owczarzaki ATCC 30864]|uniref:Rap-GAP domain-containing protein n=1 Tax=Capsaspora owczarzaki (strain ATCC 30864) TaxID=595528 RepID=A0A0D2WL90_CAPO3|nr:hypothetical protein CAOG_08551 [Capsaspora owczarzaki ATCC 30864]KJE90553.1 hypothetical protein CAOG_008551 [Capsaspora owczarzaki ATCC 30864]|eukprot:XP_011270133.1 hypothetical protein CAOG_08551 [Capsaspora owczarzaki ATCC 30864]